MTGVASDAAVPPLVSPGRSNGLLDVLRWRFLLKLLVRKELRVRYRGSVLGLLWSYVKPGVQLVVFYVAMGKFLGLDHKIPNFAIYLFSGIVMVNFFSEVFDNTTRSIVLNADLVKKIFLPRELFPVSLVWVAIVHLLPQLVVLIAGALLVGWAPNVAAVGAALLALLIVMVLGLGLGLLFGALNVLFRDFENLVDLILMMATWTSPVLYSWDLVRKALPDALWYLYQANPLTAAVELAHYGFWGPTSGAKPPMPPHVFGWGLAGLLSGLVILVVGQLAFRKLEGRFAQEL